MSAEPQPGWKGFGWQAALTSLSRVGVLVPAPRPRFGHGAEVVLATHWGDGGKGIEALVDVTDALDEAPRSRQVRLRVLPGAEAPAATEPLEDRVVYLQPADRE